jgi:putative FmdB family regulatory protein
VPIYEYLCESCGKLTEVVQKLNDPPPRKCSECGSRKLARLVSRSAFQLKGGGWYSDLYSTAKKKEATTEKAPAEKAPAEMAPASPGKEGPAPPAAKGTAPATKGKPGKGGEG